MMNNELLDVMMNNELLDEMIRAINETGAGFASVSIGKYTIIVTNDPDGAEYLGNAWDKYVGLNDNEVE